MHFATLSVSLALFSATGWAAYVLEDDYFSGNFFDQFTFWDQDDPTHGFVEYQGQKAAADAGLINTTSSGAYMGVDHTNECPNGRPSVRITSNKSYNTGLVVIDLAHMPGSICGAWPAFWMLGPNWPNGGEIDIIEGVNDQVGNKATLHTGPGCSIEKSDEYSGTLKYNTCASSGDNNNGCQIADDGTNSYGTNFNNIGGGTYAAEWTADYISVWFWPRGSCPEDVLGASPNPAGWGSPFAKFQGDCNFKTSFKDQQLVFDTTFCGDWAGKAFTNSTCAAKADSCEAYVQNNPGAFTEAYWSINALKVYSDNGESSNSTSTYITTSTSTQYVTLPESSYVAQTTMPTAYPTTLATSTKSEGDAPAPESTSPVDTSSPSETASSYVPVVGSDGSVVHESAIAASPPAYTGGGGGGGWFSDANGAMGYSGGHGHGSHDLGSETRDIRAKHLQAHKRNGKGRL